MITDCRYHPEVLQVVAGRGYELYVYFSDGSIHRFDAESLLGGEVFAPLRDPEHFRRTLTVLNGTVAWDVTGDRDPERCIDIDPIVLYRQTPEVDEAYLAEIAPPPHSSEAAEDPCFSAPFTPVRTSR